jgi:pyruvate/2-oxoglutarate dehydrogenase complex dihydrolipoamide acyltransferase (E2) component
VRTVLKLPRVAETVDEVVVMEWLVASGDSVVPGQVIMRVETDKALVDVPAPVGGVVQELLVAVDEEIATGHPIIVLDGSSE